jgi:Na+/proline symporter/signal transduction histidine kinase
MDGQKLIILVAFYSVILFAIAWWSERYKGFHVPWWRPLIYSLSIGVYCSSWTFLGAVGQAVENGWHYLPIYLGPILLFLFGWPFLQRLLKASHHNKVTSIADYIGSRYGKNQFLAAAVTLVLVVGTLPYIALQLRGVGIAWASLNWQADVSAFGDSSSLIAAMIMAWFSILFGTRVIDGPDRLRGLITTVAAESIIKVIAFVAVGLLAYSLVNYDSSQPLPNYFRSEQISSTLFFTEILLAATAIICLPRQFHVMVVEYQSPADTRYVRWLLPLYLTAFALFVIPLAQAGGQLFGDLNISGDSYVLSLPRFTGDAWLLALTFIGALSAATGMVVVATIALSIMVSNELIVPVWLRPKDYSNIQTKNLARGLRYIRRIVIILILAASWLLERIMSNNDGLASIGLIAFAACAQLLPSVLASLYWKKGHAWGVLSGLVVGMSIWFYSLLLPALLESNHSLIMDGFLNISWLAPHNLFGLGFLDPLSHGVLISLALNALAFILISRLIKPGPVDERQTERFVFEKEMPLPGPYLDTHPSTIEVLQLHGLINPLFGEERSMRLWRRFERQIGHRLLPHDYAPNFVISAIEHELGSIIGAASAHKSMTLLAKQTPLQLQDFVNLVSGSSQQINFSQNLLQTTLETIPQGISVVDRNLKLAAWNQQYKKMFDFPKRLLYVGCHIKKVYEFNAQRGYLGSDDIKSDALVEKRLAKLASGRPYRLERELPNGKVLEIQGTPLPEGGYVTTFMDITEYHNIVSELAQAKNTLEQRVALRTQELEMANASLSRENQLRALSEKQLSEVHNSKSRFLAAASHDLLQPVHASRLFITSLQDQIEKLTEKNESLVETSQQLDDALSQTEQLINSLREISRLSSGKESAHKEHFSLDSLLRPLANEAQVIAKKKNIEFRWINSRLWLHSDPQMLRRVLQNFVSNALRYTQKGKVLMGVRKQGDFVSLQVWDSGPGIVEDAMETIFEEFERLPSAKGEQGLGLGLSIAQRISRLLGHPITVQSEINKGSCFSILVPLGHAKQVTVRPHQVDPNLSGIRVVCIDNELVIQSGMRSLLEQWGCQVVTAFSLGEALSQLTSSPNIILADYHLDEATGVDAIEALRLHFDRPIPAIVISADNSEAVMQHVETAHALFLSKPVAPAALRNLMRRQIQG